MDNPHVKEDWFCYYLEEKEYSGDNWHDTNLQANVGGLGMIMCTISINGWHSCNAGFRIVDENDCPLLPYGKKINNRAPTHFSFEPPTRSAENLTSVTFHIIANCQYAKLQVRPSDTGGGQDSIIGINAVDRSGPVNAAWNHKTIRTMSAIPLIPRYQGGANTIFTYPKSRTPRMPDDDKPPVTYPDKINPSSSSGVPPQ